MSSRSIANRQFANVLSRFDEVGVSAAGVRLSETSLVLPSDLGWEDWLALGQGLVRLKDQKEAELRTVKFWIGDLLRFGEAKWGEKYAQVAEQTGYADQTLYNIQWVAEAVPPRNRHPDLSFEHHAEVAALDGPDQVAALGRAVKENLSAKNLRHRLREDRARDEGRDPNGVAAERYLGQAAERLGETPAPEWAAVVYAGLIEPLRRKCPLDDFERFCRGLGRLLDLACHVVEGEVVDVEQIGEG